MKLDAPVTWHSTCPHCLRGKQSDMDLTVKRSLQVLASLQIINNTEKYLVPTNDQSCSVIVERVENKLDLKIIPDNQTILDGVWDRGRLKSPHKHLLLRSKILDRSLKLIASSKPANLRIVKSSLMPLLLKQRKEGIPTHRRFACFKIDWASVVLSLC